MLAPGGFNPEPYRGRLGKKDFLREEPPLTLTKKLFFDDGQPLRPGKKLFLREGQRLTGSFKAFRGLQFPGKPH